MDTIQLIKRSKIFIENHCKKEIDEFNRFMSLKQVTVGELERFVFVYQRNAKLRIHGEKVSIDDYKPPVTFVCERLMNLLESSRDAYEKLHPFTDCNGRSGCMLWYWMSQRETYMNLGFLRVFYIQTLERSHAN